jgi:uncharacterized membrane protein YeiH
LCPLRQVVRVDGSTIFEVVDLLSVFIGALTGALVARRLRYDITGHWALGLVSGLGGGLIRDVLLQVGPPLALVEPAYLPTVLAATLVRALFGSRIDQLRKTILVVDAFAISAFAVAGSLRTLDVGLGVWPTILLGVTTAVGGGVIREVLIGETPMIFRRSELYATAALGACLAVIIMRELGSPREITVAAGIAFGTFVRLGSLRSGWMSWQPR